MLNLHELESRWLRYKIKSYVPHAVITISLFVIVFVISLLDFSNTKKEIKITKVIEKIQKPIISEQTPVVVESKSIIPEQTPVVVESKPIIPEQIPVVVESKPIIPEPTKKEILTIDVNEEKNNENTKILISPSLDFMNTISSSSPRYYNENKTIIKKSKVYTQKVKVTKPIIKTPKIEKKVVIEVEVPKIEVVKNNSIKIKRQNTQNDIQHVIKRFKKSNNPALSLFVAKKYYELGDYNQAYNYALITNEINNDIEDSWIIFAKSLVKLNKKHQAIKTLDRFIKHTHSHKAKLLLDNIRLGKLK